MWQRTVTTIGSGNVLAGLFLPKAPQRPHYSRRGKERAPGSDCAIFTRTKRAANPPPPATTAALQCLAAMAATYWVSPLASARVHPLQPQTRRDRTAAAMQPARSGARKEEHARRASPAPNHSVCASRRDKGLPGTTTRCPRHSSLTLAVGTSLDPYIRGGHGTVYIHSTCTVAHKSQREKESDVHTTVAAHNSL